jgi:hypothetical protein
MLNSDPVERHSYFPLRCLVSFNFYLAPLNSLLNEVGSPLGASAPRQVRAARGIPASSVVFRAEKPRERERETPRVLYLPTSPVCFFSSPMTAYTSAAAKRVPFVLLLWALAQLAGSAIGINSLHPSSQPPC